MALVKLERVNAHAHTCAGRAERPLAARSIVYICIVRSDVVSALLRIRETRRRCNIALSCVALFTASTATAAILLFINKHTGLAEIRVSWRNKRKFSNTERAMKKNKATAPFTKGFAFKITSRAHGHYIAFFSALSLFFSGSRVVRLKLPPARQLDVHRGDVSSISDRQSGFSIDSTLDQLVYTMPQPDSSSSSSNRTLFIVLTLRVAASSRNSTSFFGSSLSLYLFFLLLFFAAAAVRTFYRRRRQLSKARDSFFRGVFT